MPALTAADRNALLREVVGAGYQILRGKGYTNHAVALATARIIEAVLYDEHQVLPVSSLLTGYAGLSDVCLSVPSVVGQTGVLRVLPVPFPPKSMTACTGPPWPCAPSSTGST